MKQDMNIDELLNGFIDGELTARQQTEVKRLIKNDPQIAGRLLELQKCKTLVSSLPRLEAPAYMLDEIRNSLERRTLLSEKPESFSHRAGARHLLIRHVLTAAAMIALIAVLASVIYTILAPCSTAEKPVAINKPPFTKESVEKPRPIMVVAKRPIEKAIPLNSTFNGRLEIKTSNLVAVNAYLNSVIEDTGLSEKAPQKSEGQKSLYTLSCSREALSMFLTDMGNIWDRFDSATLFVETDKLGRQIEVDAATAEQIAKIAGQDSLKNTVQVAKDFAILNNITGQLPGKEILNTIEDTKGNLITIPKPRLTSGEKTIKKPTSQQETEPKVHLTIVITGSE